MAVWDRTHSDCEVATIGDPIMAGAMLTIGMREILLKPGCMMSSFRRSISELTLGDFVSGDHYDTLPEIEAMWEHAMTDSFSRLFDSVGLCHGQPRC